MFLNPHSTLPAAAAASVEEKEDDQEHTSIHHFHKIPNPLFSSLSSQFRNQFNVFLPSRDAKNHLME